MQTVQDNGYGRQFHGWYDRLFPEDGRTAEAVAQLARLHPDPASGTLELGVGTGRIALPLADRVGRITGVDASAEMLAQLRAKPGASNRIVAVRADMRDYEDERRHGLVYSVCGTISLITDAAGQARAVARAAALLTPGGRLVIESHNRPAIVASHEGRVRTSYFVPYPEPGTGVQVYSTLLEEAGLWHCAHIWHEGDGTTRVGTELTRPVTPDEVDGYARAAGLVSEAAWGGWGERPYDEDSPSFVCSYTKATG